MRQRFEGTDNYIATDDLKVAVNAAIALERPLLIMANPAPAKLCSPMRSPTPWAPN